ncbi:hypothetical protein DSM25559_5160 [Agrobacterium rosae]|uniref:Uncharacterized protein n=1 Tax=Agrobacterium rosae TaxID=1972867 RepID=A0A1R3U639_9HYPH|nr:hypothetical protein DSM25559_5160 [Agrobacterium rosae]
MDAVGVALSLMRGALTLLDEPDTELIAQHLRLAIEAAEQKFSSDERSDGLVLPDAEDPDGPP